MIGASIWTQLAELNGVVVFLAYSVVAQWIADIVSLSHLLVVGHIMNNYELIDVNL